MKDFIGDIIGVVSLFAIGYGMLFIGYGLGY
jgi:hypothetical protein